MCSNPEILTKPSQQDATSDCRLDFDAAVSLDKFSTVDPMKALPYAETYNC